MIAATTFYRALLRCYPAAFRDEYGGQMLLTFAQQLGEARQTGGRGRRAALCMTAAWDALTVAPGEHWNVIHRDIRFALRALAAHPGFAAVAILSLTLGIGANTAIFSLWNGVLHSTLPGVRHPEQLVILSNPEDAGLWHGNSQGEREWLTYTEFEQLREQATSFSSLMASESSLDRWHLRYPGGGWEEAHGRLVSDEYFSFLGVKPVIGRPFSKGERAAVISYPYWQRRFGGSPAVVGQSFVIHDIALTIVGVAPPGFIGETAGQQPDLWAPLALQPAILPGEDRLHETPPGKAMWLHVFGRLKPGVTPARAEAESNAIFKAGLESFYGTMQAPDRRREFLDQYLKLRSAAHGASAARGDFSTPLTVLLVAVGVLLLIACANLANLLLARAAVRRPEMALRLSLGAGRGRLVRQLATESLVLASLGGIGGLAAAWLLYRALVRMVVQSDPTFQMDFSLDPLVLAFTVGVTFAAGLLFGLLPAWQATRTDAAGALKEQSRGAGTRLRWGRSLVSLQLALSLPLLAGAGLLARTLFNLQHVDLGYPTDRLVVAGIDSRIAGYNSARSGVLFRDLLEGMRRIPGVRAATMSHNGLFTGSQSGDPVEVEGYTPTGADSDRHSSWEMVGPDYFSTLGIPVLLGREILASDSSAAPKVCVINQAFARKFFPGRNPVGAHVTAVDELSSGLHRTTYQVIGVAREARTSSLRDQPKPLYYMPFTQPHGDNVKRTNFIIRTSAENSSVLASVRQLIQRTDPSLPIVYARVFRDQIAPSTAPDRATAQVAIVFGIVALALAAIGLYGVLSYGIARRKGEFAIRIALGARPTAVVGMVLCETGALIATGLIVGGALSYAVSRWIASELYGVKPQDPLTLAAATAILLLAAFTAVYLPARRASRQDPIIALRHE